MHDEMQPQDDLHAGSQMLPSGEPDHEGAMARADLYKLANYSVKLFKKLNDHDQLEGWVQAKITKAADYIASVYHYLEYEMKFSEYGQALDNSDVLSESQKAALKNKLLEAKAKVKELKKAQAEKVTKKVEEGKDKCTCEDSESSCKVHSKKKVEEDQTDLKKTGDSYKTKRGGTVTKTDSGLKHEKGDYSDEDHAEPAQSKASKASKSAAEKKADKEKEIKLPKHKGNTWGMKGGEKFGKKMEEGAKPDFLDMDKDGDKKEPMKKAVKDKAKKKVAEAAKPDYIDLDKDGNKKEPMKKAAKDAKSKVKEAVKKAKKAIEEGSIQNGVWVASPDKGVPPPSDPDGGSAPAPKKPAAKKPAAPAKPGVKKAEAEPADGQTALAESKELSHIKMLAGL